MNGTAMSSGGCPREHRGEDQPDLEIRQAAHGKNGPEDDRTIPVGERAERRHEENTAYVGSHRSYLLLMERSAAMLTLAGGVAVLGGSWARRRLPKAITALFVGGGASCVAAGGLLLQPGATPADWAVALPVAAGIALLHVRLLLGAFGAPRS